MSELLSQQDRLPDPGSFGVASLLIYDRKLVRFVPGFASWAKRFHAAYPVTSGEGLKALERFPRHMAAIGKLCAGLSRTQLVIVSAGGGSVGDFSGFVASVFQRGVRLVHVPTTWLAAIDSAHGGKTALNVGGIKNQVGTFHPAERVILVRDVLVSQPEVRAREAMGELAKTALLDRGLYRKITTAKRASKTLGVAELWKFLPAAIGVKNKIVRQDPYERLGIRHLLNLGHSIGHALEAFHKIPHGSAVGQGLWFSLEFSHKKGWLSPKDRAELGSRLTQDFGIVNLAGVLPRLPKSRLEELLARDKKVSSQGIIRWIALLGAGEARAVELPISELVRESIRQGWASR